MCMDSRVRILLPLHILKCWSIKRKPLNLSIFNIIFRDFSSNAFIIHTIQFHTFKKLNFTHTKLYSRIILIFPIAPLFSLSQSYSCRYSMQFKMFYQHSGTRTAQSVVLQSLIRPPFSHPNSLNINSLSIYRQSLSSLLLLDWSSIVPGEPIRPSIHLLLNLSSFPYDENLLLLRSLLLHSS